MLDSKKENSNDRFHPVTDCARPSVYQQRNGKAAAPAPAADLPLHGHAGQKLVSENHVRLWLSDHSMAPPTLKGSVVKRVRTMPLEGELQRIYDSEINIEIGWLWDGGITIKLGDPLNGYQAGTTVPTVAEILPWLQRAIARHCPDSDYIKNMGQAAAIPLEPETHAAMSCSHRCPGCVK
jgi:hypothetical protein